MFHEDHFDFPSVSFSLSLLMAALLSETVIGHLHVKTYVFLYSLDKFDFLNNHKTLFQNFNKIQTYESGLNFSRSDDVDSTMKPRYSMDIIIVINK